MVAGLWWLWISLILIGRPCTFRNSKKLDNENIGVYLWWIDDDDDYDDDCWHMVTGTNERAMSTAKPPTAQLPKPCHSQCIQHCIYWYLMHTAFYALLLCCEYSRSTQSTLPSCLSLVTPPEYCTLHFTDCILMISIALHFLFYWYLMYWILYASFYWYFKWCLFLERSTLSILPSCLSLVTPIALYTLHFTDCILLILLHSDLNTLHTALLWSRLPCLNFSVVTAL